MSLEFTEFDRGYFSPCEITTYLGEKYYGLFVDAEDQKKNTYFLPFTKDFYNNYTFKKWREVENENKSTEILEKYGCLIPGKEFIKGFSLGSSNAPMVQARPGMRNGEVFGNKLFIIGAGASNGFSYNGSTGWRPPLVNDIFSEQFKEIYKKYKGVVKCLSSIRFKQDVEKYFQDEWDLLNLSYAPELLRNQINTQYYLRELFKVITEKNREHEASLYKEFVRNLDKYLRTHPKERINIISFNYDYLLEEAIINRDKFSITSIDDYISDAHRINIFKPHGSANWGWEVDTSTPHPITFNITMKHGSIPFSDLPGFLYENQFTLDKIYGTLLNEGYASGYGKLVLNTAKLKVINSARPFYPGLLVPYLRKDEFLMPFSHRTLLESEIGFVKEICIIGWKGREEVFNEFLKQKIANKKIKLTIVDPNYKNVMENLNFLQIDGELKTYKGFDEYCRSL